MGSVRLRDGKRVAAVTVSDVMGCYNLLPVMGSVWLRDGKRVAPATVSDVIVCRGIPVRLQDNVYYSRIIPDLSYRLATPRQLLRYIRSVSRSPGAPCSGYVHPSALFMHRIRAHQDHRNYEKRDRFP